MERSKKKLDIYNEFKRKGIHLSSSLIPVVYYYTSKEFAVIGLAVMLALSITIDLLRYYNTDFKQLFDGLFHPILRQHEKELTGLVFTGATYLVFSCLLCIVIFPMEIAIMSILVLTISDSCAALVGKFMGKISIKDKTLEGSIAFFISGLFIIFLTPKIDGSLTEYIIAVSVLLVVTIVELLPIRLDDNIVIPLSFGGLYFLLVKMFL